MIDRARAYLAKVPPATEGNRNDSLNKLAFAILERFTLQECEFEDLLAEWAASCSPPIPDGEALKTIHSAWAGANAKGAVGSKQRADHITRPPRRPDAAKAKPEAKAPAKKYHVEGRELPDPMEDGARELLKACFQAGEGVRIANAKIDEDKGGEVPDGSGPCLSREEWLTKLDKAKGNPNGIFSSSKRTGIYIGLNPYKIGGSKDSDVTAYRHALVEFDKELSPEEQFNLYQKSNLPCAAVIYSGGKSVHAWVKVDAATRQEYDERVRILYQHFESAGYQLDSKNKNPGRLSRLPNCVRFDRRQELLALNIGAESFSAWLADIEADGIGETSTFTDLYEYDSDADGQTILGHRWLCRGGSCLLVGPSGVGKSSLVLQLVLCWALGRPAFGITPTRPLKIMVVQAENDKGDMHEMIEGVCGGLGIMGDEIKTLQKNLIFNRNLAHTGHAFTESLRRLIDKHKPDLVVLDPLLSFIGADISRQEVCSQFLRNWLNPIAEASNVVWLMVHHTGKPSQDPKAKKSWAHSDYSYSGMGSSELTNWTRATMTLETAGEAFRLMLSKRGKRAGATHPNGDPALTLWLRHGQKGIWWEQIDPPQEAPEEAKKAGRKPYDWHLGNFLASIKGEQLTRSQISSRACKFGGFKVSHFDHQIWPLLKPELTQDGKTWSPKI